MSHNVFGPNGGHDDALYLINIDYNQLMHYLDLHGGHDDDGIVQDEAEAGQYTSDGQEANVVKRELGRLNDGRRKEEGKRYKPILVTRTGKEKVSAESASSSVPRYHPSPEHTYIHTDIHTDTRTHTRTHTHRSTHTHTTHTQ